MGEIGASSSVKDVDQPLAREPTHMKRHIFSWQKTLQQLGRGVIWQNKLLHRSRNGKQPEYQTQRRPTWESLEPRHLLAGIGFQLVTQQAKVHEHSGALISSSSPSSLIGEKGPWKEGELVMQADGEGSSSFLPPNRISITSAETLLSFDGVTTLTQNAVGESVLTSNGVVFGNDPERNGVALLNGRLTSMLRIVCF